MNVSRVNNIKYPFFQRIIMQFEELLEDRIQTESDVDSLIYIVNLYMLSLKYLKKYNFQITLESIYNLMKSVHQDAEKRKKLIQYLSSHLNQLPNLLN